MMMEVIGPNHYELESIDKQVSVQVLRKQTLTIISTLLNPPKVIPTGNGTPRDWNGLAHLCGISGERLPNLQNDADPTKKILSLWCEKDKEGSTIETLLDYFEQLDRYDIIDDIIQSLSEDISWFKTHPPSIEQKLPDLEMDRCVLTRDDVSRISEGLEPQLYDAFVLFADDDIDFATEVIQTMENQYNMKFCVKDRDLVAGGLEYEVIIKLISQRCNRLIVIISPTFFNSPANKYFLSFAKCIGIEGNDRKIIPCVYKQCTKIPDELKGYFMLDYTRSGKLFNFWDKLHDSVRTPILKPKALTHNNNNMALQQNNTLESNKTIKKSLKSVVLIDEPIEIDSLKPHHVVKFNSMVNLNNINVEIDQNLSGSISANDLVTCPETNNKNNKVNKTKTNWLKKILKHKHSERKSEKKTFFNLVTKKKVAVPAS